MASSETKVEEPKEKAAPKQKQPECAGDRKRRDQAEWRKARARKGK